MKKIVLIARAAPLIALLCLILQSHAENKFLETYLLTSWDYDLNNYANRVIVTDLQGDGTNEIIVSTRDGLVYCLGTMFKSHLFWHGPIMLNGDVRAVVVDDVDGDGKKETLMGSDRPENNIKLVDWQGLNKGNTIDFRQRIYSLDIGDADGDGKKDIVIGSSDAGVYVYKYGAEKHTWSYKTNGPVYYVRVADIDGDGRNEVAALSLWTYNDLQNAEVSVIDSSGTLLWKYAIDGGVYSFSTTDFEVADINGDGSQEVVVGTNKKGVIVLGADGKKLWNYDTGNMVSAVYVANLGGREKTILAASVPAVYALDTEGRVDWRFQINTTVYSMCAGDLDPNGRPEILIGANKYIHVLAHDGSLIATQNRGIEIVGFGKAPMVKNVDARSVSTGDVDGDGRVEAVVGYGWTESRLDSNYNLGKVVVYKVNETFFKSTPQTQQTTTTLADETKPTTSTRKTTTSSSTTIKVEQTTAPPTTASTEPEKPKEKDQSQGMWPFIVLVLAAALLVSIIIIFLLYRRTKPKEVSIKWPGGQDI